MKGRFMEPFYRRRLIRYVCGGTLLAIAPLRRGLQAAGPSETKGKAKAGTSAEVLARSRALFEELSHYGFSTSQDRKANPPRCDVRLTQEVYLGHLSELRELGMINARISPMYILLHLYSVGFSLLIDYMPIVINVIFGSQDAPEKMHFSGYLRYPSGNGTEKEQIAVSFDFSKALARKINWANFPPYQLIHTAPNFVIEPWLKEKMAEEGKT
ncbi:MAG: hypothetical protein K6U10_01770 [Acidobacteriia bacterium]|nr:hypothetical protein [Methyloceanibacter sp.]MCL6490528.1 hypothetical protein [Terriglobia bacterium]